MPPSGQERRRMATSTPGYLSDCLYLVVFSMVYGLSFAMPFWSEDDGASNSTTTTTTIQPGPRVTTQSFPAHARPAYLVWRYSWEYVGLGVRCVSLGLLVTGGVVSVGRLCCGTMHLTPPRALPAVCGITAGVAGTYAELVLWLGVKLLAPNPVLTQSQVFCSVTSIFCLVIGIVVYKPRGCNRSSLSCRQDSVDVEPCAVCRDRFIQFPGNETDFVIIECNTPPPPPPPPSLQPPPPQPSPPSSPPPPETSQGCLVAAAAEIDVESVEQEIHGDDHHSEPSETEELGKDTSVSFADYVSADKCSPDDLPEDLRRRSEERLLESVPEQQSSGDALLDLPKLQSSGTTQRDLPKLQSSGTTQRDLTKLQSSGTTQRDLAKLQSSGTTQRDLAKHQSSRTALLDLLEHHSSGTTLKDLPKHQSSGAALLDLPKHQSSGAALLDLPKHQSFGGAEPSSPEDVDAALLLTRGESGHGEHLLDHDDFDHSIQFIDDDLYYHSSDDDRLETLIQQGNAREQLSGVSETSVNSTTLLIHTGRGLLHPYCDSDEFHSLSDDDTAKNRTWP